MGAEAILDLDEALARIDHDRDLFCTLADLLIEQGPKDLSAVQAAVAAGDAAAVARAAHRLKGAVLQFAAPTVYQSVAELEALGKAQTLATAEQVCVQVERGLTQLLEALREIVAKGAQV